MNVRFLIDAIVRQTTVLIARLATVGGARAPLAHIANQVFLDLATDLEEQGVGRKVSADMFGLALRSYRRKLQRLGESSTDRGRSLWDAVHGFVAERGPINRAEVMRRFRYDEEALVRGVLHDLLESGFIARSGSGPSAVYRLTSSDEVGAMRTARDPGATDALVWVTIYREGPIDGAALGEVSRIPPDELAASVERLGGDGRVATLPDGRLACGEFAVHLESSIGWEAAVLDHYQALVQTVCAKLEAGPGGAAADVVGGSTYTFDVWEGHPFREEVLGLLRRLRREVGALREQVEAYNRGQGLPERHESVVAYLGQRVFGRRDDEGEGDEDAVD